MFTFAMCCVLCFLLEIVEMVVELKFELVELLVIRLWRFVVACVFLV